MSGYSMKPTMTSRSDTIYGLQALAAYMGRRDPRCIIRWRERLGFPLFLDHTALLSGKNRYYTTVEAIKAWEHALANATAQAQGREYDPSCPCPLCGRSGDARLGSEGSGPDTREP